MSVQASTIRPTPSVPSPSATGPSAATTSGYVPGPESLQDVAKGGHVGRGMSGPAVLDLQRKLNAAGMQPPLAEDGLFGPKTQAAVRAFQRSNTLSPGLGADGIVGAQTLSALAGGGRFPTIESHTHDGGAHCAPHPNEAGHTPAGTVKAGTLAMADAARRGGAASGANGVAASAFGSTPQARASQAEQLLAQNKVPLEEGKTYVVQIDQAGPSASASSKEKSDYLRSYSGQTSVFRAEGGRLVEVDGPFRSASHPGQKATSSQKFTDVDGDGTDDIAHLRPGVYEYNMGTTSSGRFNPVNNRQISVARDLDHDGAISASEDALAQQHGFTATALQWHAGGSTRPSSVGCQTMPPNDFARFRNAVQGGEGGSFTYLLARTQ